jgi:hypothetical protein
MKDWEDWPHPDRCPGSDCRGQFFWIRHYGMICSIRLAEEMDARGTRSPDLAAMWMSREAFESKSEGLGLA